jgi:WD40 repeat protein
LINAHENSISCLALNNDGSLLATSSEKGTLIRIFRADDGAYLQELRRGKEKAEIYSIAFDVASMYLATSSDRGTVHIWSLTTTHKKLKELGLDITINQENNQEIPKNQTSVLSKLFGGYFNSEWSFAQLRIDESKSICSFGSNNTILVVTMSGKLYQATFDIKRKGECINIQENSLNLAETN